MYTKTVGEDERFFHFCDDFFSSLSSEGGIALDEFEEEDSQPPDVDFVIVGLFLDHFRCHILEGATEGVPIFQDGGEPKITQLSMVIISNQDILGFYIPMHEVVAVQVVHCLANVPEILSDQGFAELPVTELDLVVQRSTRSVLEDHVSGVFVLFVVVVEQLYNVGVVQFMMHVNLLLGIFAVNLSSLSRTILIATISPFSVLRASFTSP